MNRYEIEIKTSRNQPGDSFYVEARTEAEALRKAKAHAKRSLNATAFRFAAFIFC